ncbi:MAG: NTP transferase domain-containing protein [bacterium]|nr:NTP transferase domain-containing protein [bacterium]
MKELADLLSSAREASAAGEPMAVATIIGVRGSTYRREGARMLVTRSGRLTGSISGGCLEGDVAVVAGDVMERCLPRVMLYDLTADDDAVWGLGLGCNGAIEVFVEPVTGDDLLWQAAEAVLDGAALGLVTVVEGGAAVPAGGRIAVWPDGRCQGGLGDAALDKAAARIVLSASGAHRSRIHVLGAEDGPQIRLFVEALHPPLRLIVCGAGHDAIPVVRLASQLGWRVLVVDRREAFLTPERFPGATGFLRTEFPEAGGTVPTDSLSFVLVMTHNYVHDRDLLRAFLPTPARYLGMLGPRARTEKILRELVAEGVAIGDDRRAQIYGPVGLDIGGDTPDEIALAALSEILAVARGRAGGFLRARAGPIHLPAQNAGSLVSAVILAAGASTRMGRPKLAIPVRGTPMIRRVVEAALASRCGETIMVLGTHAELYRSLLDGLAVRIVENPDPTRGMASSIRAGIESVSPDASGAVILLADQPFVSAEVIDRLIESAAGAGRRIVASEHHGAATPPVFFPRAFFPELLALEGDRGARSVIQSHPGEYVLVPLPESCAADVDTSADLSAIDE